MNMVLLSVRLQLKRPSCMGNMFGTWLVHAQQDFGDV